MSGHFVYIHVPFCAQQCSYCDFFRVTDRDGGEARVDAWLELILKEMRLALQECGRRLGAHIRKGIRINQELKKRSYIEKYIPAIGEALRDILSLGEKDVDKLCANLKDVLERSRKF